MARKQVGLAFPVIDAAGVWWQESRPEEGGRLAVVRQGPDGVKRDLLPSRGTPGPGCTSTAASRTCRCRTGSSSRTSLTSGCTGAGRRQRAGPEPGAADPGAGRDAADRFADFVLSPAGDEVWCVRERHLRHGSRITRAIVAVPLDGSAAGDRRRGPGAGQRFGLLRLPGPVAGRHPAGLDLLGSPADAVGRHRTAGRRARRRRAGQRPGAAGDHGRRRRVGAGPGRGGTTAACT